MNVNHLSDRLASVASFVKDGARLADIGSDHAYLPVNLASQDKITSAIAGEVVAGPFQSAQQEIARQELGHMVEARLGDGLAVIEPADQIDTITICGMGGALIVDILDQGLIDGKLATNPRLILQPNVAEDKVRQWLNTHSYEIVDEAMIAENGKFYEVIVADYRDNLQQELTSDDILFGLFNKEIYTAIFQEKWQLELKRTNYVLDQLEQASNCDEIKIARYQELKTAIQAQLA